LSSSDPSDLGFVDFVDFDFDLGLESFFRDKSSWCAELRLLNPFKEPSA